MFKSTIVTDKIGSYSKISKWYVDKFLRRKNPWKRDGVSEDLINVLEVDISKIKERENAINDWQEKNMTSEKFRPSYWWDIIRNNQLYLWGKYNLELNSLYTDMAAKLIDAILGKPLQDIVLYSKPTYQKDSNSIVFESSWWPYNQEKKWSLLLQESGEPWRISKNEFLIRIADWLVFDDSAQKLYDELDVIAYYCKQMGVVISPRLQSCFGRVVGSKNGSSRDNEEYMKLYQKPKCDKAIMSEYFQLRRDIINEISANGPKILDMIKSKKMPYNSQFYGLVDMLTNVEWVVWYSDAMLNKSRNGVPLFRKSVMADYIRLKKSL